MTEINWTSLLHKLQADLESGDWLTKSYQIAGRRREIRDVNEFLELLKYVEQKAAVQTKSVSGRTYARPIRPR